MQGRKTSIGEQVVGVSVVPANATEAIQVISRVLVGDDKNLDENDSQSARIRSLPANSNTDNGTSCTNTIH